MQEEKLLPDYKVPGSTHIAAYFGIINPFEQFRVQVPVVMKVPVIHTCGSNVELSSVELNEYLEYIFI